MTTPLTPAEERFRATLPAEKQAEFDSLGHEERGYWIDDPDANES